MIPTTLSLCAAAALINLWIFFRVVKIRGSEKINHGDGGNALLARRMRAHANFIENTPLVLLLIGGLELSGKGGQWLAIVGGIFILGRVAHVIGMDSEKPALPRWAGTVTALLTQLGLAVVAVLTVLGKF